MKNLISVPDFPLYSADIDNGLVYNIRNGKRLKGSNTKTKSGKDSYVTCSLYKNGQTKNTTIHCVIMASFIGTWDFNGKEVDHINRVRYDNRISNLRLVTRKEQMTEDVCRDISNTRKKQGDTRTQEHKDNFQQMSIGSKNYKSKLKESDIINIRKMYSGNYGEGSSIARLFGVCPSTIIRILKMKNWTHV